MTAGFFPQFQGNPWNWYLTTLMDHRNFMEVILCRSSLTFPSLLPYEWGYLFCFSYKLLNFEIIGFFHLEARWGGQRSIESVCIIVVWYSSAISALKSSVLVPGVEKNRKNLFWFWFPWNWGNWDEIEWLSSVSLKSRKLKNWNLSSVSLKSRKLKNWNLFNMLGFKAGIRERGDWVTNAK